MRVIAKLVPEQTDAMRVAADVFVQDDGWDLELVATMVQRGLLHHSPPVLVDYLWQTIEPLGERFPHWDDLARETPLTGEQLRTAVMNATIELTEELARDVIERVALPFPPEPGDDERFQRFSPEEITTLTTALAMLHQHAPSRLTAELLREAEETLSRPPPPGAQPQP
jgi:hypothetical protein